MKSCEFWWLRLGIRRFCSTSVAFSLSLFLLGSPSCFGLLSQSPPPTISLFVFPFATPLPFITETEHNSRRAHRPEDCLVSAASRRSASPRTATPFFSPFQRLPSPSFIKLNERNHDILPELPQTGVSIFGHH